MNWLLVTDGSRVHVVPVGDVIEHEIDPALQPCVCLPMCRPLYCEHGDHIGWLLQHSVLSPEPQGHEHG